MVTKWHKKGNGNAIFLTFLSKVKNLFSEIFFTETPLPSEKLT